MYLEFQKINSPLWSKWKIHTYNPHMLRFSTNNFSSFL